MAENLIYAVADNIGQLYDSHERNDFALIF